MAYAFSSQIGRKRLGCNRDRVTAVRLEYRNGTMLGRTHATSGLVDVKHTRHKHAASLLQPSRFRWVWLLKAYATVRHGPCGVV